MRQFIYEYKQLIMEELDDSEDLCIVQEGFCQIKKKTKVQGNTYNMPFAILGEG